ncbi:MAG TPA: hypothetical protein VHP31_11890 [Caproicibacter sp.]|nr:hypothetical protein [Caproicibacter sp.]
MDSVMERFQWEQLWKDIAQETARAYVSEKLAWAAMLPSPY